MVESEFDSGGGGSTTPRDDDEDDDDEASQSRRGPQFEEFGDEATERDQTADMASFGPGFGGSPNVRGGDEGASLDDLGGFASDVREEIETPDLEERSRFNRENIVKPGASAAGEAGGATGEFVTEAVSEAPSPLLGGFGAPAEVGASAIEAAEERGVDVGAAGREAGERVGRGAGGSIASLTDLPGAAVDVREGGEFAAAGAGAVGRDVGELATEADTDADETGEFIEERAAPVAEGAIESARSNPLRTAGALGGAVVGSVAGTGALRAAGVGRIRPGFRQRQIGGSRRDVDLDELPDEIESTSPFPDAGEEVAESPGAASVGRGGSDIFEGDFQTVSSFDEPSGVPSESIFAGVAPASVGGAQSRREAATQPTIGGFEDRELPGESFVPAAAEDEPVQTPGQAARSDQAFGLPDVGAGLADRAGAGTRSGVLSRSAAASEGDQSTQQDTDDRVFAFEPSPAPRPAPFVGAGGGGGGRVAAPSLIDFDGGNEDREPSGFGFRSRRREEPIPSLFELTLGTEEG